MNPEQHDFAQLRRLLSLKRHEQPPPGFYDLFSCRVIARIEAGETGEEVTFFNWFFGQALWIQRLRAAFETEFVLAGAAGFVLCGLVATEISFGGTTTRANVGTVLAITHAEPPATEKINPVPLLMIEGTGLGAVPPDWLQNPLGSPPSRVPIQNVPWMR